MSLALTLAPTTEEGGGREIKVIEREREREGERKREGGELDVLMERVTN